MGSPSRRWTIDRAALDALIVRLGGGREGASEYEALRRKLIPYLDRRGASSPEAAADETLDRVARKLVEGEAITNVRGYVFGVARHVLMEGERQDHRDRVTREAWVRLNAADPKDESERRLACLERCLRGLPAESRELVVRYHSRGGGAGEREALARRFGLAPGALRTRMHRLRNGLATCLAACLQSEDGRP